MVLVSTPRTVRLTTALLTVNISYCVCFLPCVSERRCAEAKAQALGDVIAYTNSYSSSPLAHTAKKKSCSACKGACSNKRHLKCDEQASALLGEAYRKRDAALAVPLPHEGKLQHIAIYACELAGMSEHSLGCHS